jgi:hypothetical protein
MSDLQWLFLILALLYLWECACWLRRGAVAFIAYFGRGWRLQFPSRFLGNQHGGFVFTQPFPPLGRIVVTADYALSLSQEGACAFLAFNSSPGWRPAHTGEFARYADLREVIAQGKTLRVNGKTWARFGSHGAAQRHARRLSQLKLLAPMERERGIRDFISQAFDEREAAQRWKEFEARTRQLRWLCNALVVYLFGLAPAAIWTLGLALTWLPLLAGLFGLSFGTAWIFNRLHRGWFPDQADDRFAQTLIVALAPASGARTVDHLSRIFMESFHPLAVAAVLLNELEFRNFARRVMLDLRHPANPLDLSADGCAVEAGRFTREEIRKAADNLLRRRGLAPETLGAPPQPADDSCRAFCPRCETQFASTAAVCADCGGLAVVPFAR